MKEVLWEVALDVRNLDDPYVGGEDFYRRSTRERAIEDAMEHINYVQVELPAQLVSRGVDACRITVRWLKVTPICAACRGRGWGKRSACRACHGEPRGETVTLITNDSHRANAAA